MNRWKNALMQIQKISYLTVIFWLFVAIYASLFLIKPQLGPTDDFTFLRTIQSGKPFIQFSHDFPYFDLITLGRFTPLAGIEYNLFHLFFYSPSPFWYFLYHAAQFILFAILFAKLLEKAGAHKTLTYLASALLFITPGFAIAWFRLQLPERNVLFLFTILVLAYLAFLKKPKASSFAIVLLAANLAIYYKEISFLAIGAFAFFHLIFSLKDKSATAKTKIMDSILLASSILYLLLYYIIIYRNTALLYLSHGFSFLGLIKNILNYTLFSDSILLLVLVPLTFLRLYAIFIKRKQAEPLYDSMLLGASAYTGAFFILNFYGPYYLLPAYALAIPGIIHFFKNYSLQSLPLFFKITGIVTASLMIVNTIPSAIHYISYTKYLPKNFIDTVDFLVEDINTRALADPTQKPSIFLNGVDRGNGRGTYFVLYDFLHYRGLNDGKYDMESDSAASDAFPISKIQPPFTVFQAGPGSKIKTGDYLIVVPQGTRNMASGYLSSLGNEYDLIFETRSPLAFPDINLKTLAKYLLSRYISEKEKRAEVVSNENLLNWPDYYVFVKR